MSISQTIYASDFATTFQDRTPAAARMGTGWVKMEEAVLILMSVNLGMFAMVETKYAPISEEVTAVPTSCVQRNTKSIRTGITAADERPSTAAPTT